MKYVAAGVSTDTVAMPVLTQMMVSSGIRQRGHQRTDNHSLRRVKQDFRDDEHKSNSEQDVDGPDLPQGDRPAHHDDEGTTSRIDVTAPKYQVSHTAANYVPKVT